MVAECLTYYVANFKDESEFSYGIACGVHPEALCPGPVTGWENLNYENTLYYQGEIYCIDEEDTITPDIV